jgi:2-phospho-L-lactate guanylyltransferase (CobY/MobA/RfbA family)
MNSALVFGPSQAILVGTDIPDLAAGVMAAALEALDAAQLVLGPARDGGFYLIGATAVPPALMSVSYAQPVRRSWHASCRTNLRLLMTSYVRIHSVEVHPSLKSMRHVQLAQCDAHGIPAVGKPPTSKCPAVRA